jgi:hypothetical protein
VLLLGLCPLELMYSRWTFLDNLVTPCCWPSCWPPRLAIPIALLARRLRPAVPVLVIQWLVLVGGGYVPSCTWST